jgi:hypothetical protein
LAKFVNKILSKKGKKNSELETYILLQLFFYKTRNISSKREIIMKKLTNLAVVALALALAGCATTYSSSIITDYDHSSSFNRYKTYDWANEFGKNANNSKKPLFYNTLIQMRIKNAIKKQMKKRGYHLNKHKPDLLVNAAVLIKQNQKTNVKTTTSPGGYSPFYPGFGGNFGYYYNFYGPETQQSTSISFKMHGGLVIQLIDRSKQQLVWQGYAPDVLHTTTQNKRKELNKAVSKIFSKYDKRFNK